MQHGTFSRFKIYGSVVILATLACAAAPAAELGELTVRSFIGQPLVADIELTALAPDELNNLHVRLASPDVFQGANISMNPVLQSLNMTVMRRDQRQFLHITSFKPVNKEYLHLFVEISGGGRSAVRSVTLWLSPDLTPVPVAAPAVKIAPPLESRPAPAPPTVPQPVLEIAPSAPARPAVGRVAPVRILPKVLAQETRSGPAGACVSEGLSKQATQCTALEHKNEALTKKLIELEGKVKMLQEGFAPASASASASASRPAPLTPLKFKPVKVSPAQIKAAGPEPVIARPRMLLAGGTVLLLLLIGLAVHLFQRRKLSKTVAVMVAPVVEPSEAEENEVAVNAEETVGAMKKPSLLRRLFGRKKAANPEAKPSDEPAID
jgi:hypothetical protein